MPPSNDSTNGAVARDERLDSALPIPLYHQAYTVLRGWISKGKFDAGEKFPSEAALCEILGVSRITIKRALSDLASEGLISRHRGRGTTVMQRKSRGVIRAEFGEMIKNLIDIDATTEVQLLGTATTVPPEDVAEELELDAGTPALQVLRRRLMDGEPYVYSVTYIPTDVAAQFPTDGSMGASMFQLLIAAGQVPQEAYQRMTATLADESIGRNLDLSVGEPILKVVRVFKTNAMRPVQHTTMYFRPDRYEYTLVLPASEVID